jgi:hypothetical protein
LRDFENVKNNYDTLASQLILTKKTATPGPGLMDGLRTGRGFKANALKREHI